MNISEEELKKHAQQKGLVDKIFFDEDKPIGGVSTNRIIQAYRLQDELKYELSKKQRLA